MSPGTGIETGTGTETGTETETEIQSLLDPVLTSEQTVSSLIMVLYRVLVSSEPPTPETLKLFLGDIIAPIYYMYAFACTAKVWLKDSLRDVLLAYFRIVGDLNAVKEIVFRRGKERKLRTLSARSISLAAKVGELKCG